MLRSSAPRAGPAVALQRQSDPIEVELVPTTPESEKELEKLGIRLPTVSDATWRAIGGVADNAGKPLSEMEKAKLDALLKQRGMPAGTPLASVTGPKVLLHDTSALVSSASIASEKAKGRGPLGKGVSAWVPVAGEATIARPDFYETKRPSTSESEKGIDIIKQADREQRLKDVWSATQDAEKGSALDRALAGTGLTETETRTVEKGAEAFFKGAADKDLPDGSKSTAAWAVGELCARAQSDGVATVAVDKRAADFEAGCKALSTYFRERSARVGSTVGIEIVQVGVKSSKGNLNTCDPANPNVVPMPSPPYSADQYANIAFLYLRAAFIAGRFPEVTTHFVVDAFERGHCDPRCFDLERLYAAIAAVLGHGKGSTYGVKPSYGTRWGSNTVWWDDKICGGPHP
jgi:hypothetical protein